MKNIFKLFYFPETYIPKASTIVWFLLFAAIVIKIFLAIPIDPIDNRDKMFIPMLFVFHAGIFIYAMKLDKFKASILHMFTGLIPLYYVFEFICKVLILGVCVSVEKINESINYHFDDELKEEDKEINISERTFGGHIRQE